MTSLLALALGGGKLAAQPFVRAHSHNDYEHQRPLLDALEQGFASVEADIYRVDGRLLVAHDRKDVRPERTLQALYLDPLRERVRANHGHVFPGFATHPALRQPLATNAPAVEFTLLIDIKEEGAAVYRALSEILDSYADMLTSFTPTNTTTRAVTVILSGDRPFELLAAEPRRFCALDGRMSDLGTNPSVHLYPLVSESWRPLFGAFQEGRIADADRTGLRALVARAHAQGRRIRFWGTPNQPAIWRELHAEGVDLLNADNLSGLAELLRSVAPPGTP